MSSYAKFIRAQETKRSKRATCILICVALLAVLFMLSGCNQWVPIATLDEELKPYFVRYEQMIGVSPWDVSASFEYINEENSAVMGKCTVHGQIKYITIYTYHWDRETELSREQIMFHELTHCVKGFMRHNNDRRQNRCPVSVMHEYHMSDNCYELHYNEYIQELIDL